MSGRKFTMVFEGFTEEERIALTDAVTLVLVEHGVNVENMRDWEGGLEDKPGE